MATTDRQPTDLIIQRSNSARKSPGIVHFTVWTTEGYGSFKGSQEAFQAFLAHKERLGRQQHRHDEFELHLRLRRYFAAFILGFLVLDLGVAYPDARRFLQDVLLAFLDYAR